ncbi:VOC family protein [Pelotalea chapellei]|uniref:VOC family protein n=1 Tax=Pelotalea chapellei TaxID=44671 RepID=A0ABS5U9C2_9BACT|nr:VOC family protein [Pelotalea chapellei]MBT1072244.1 VOC family protein [Pelotalea chapellei]
MTQPIPEGYQSVTPIFIFKDARKAIDFYKQALDAHERMIVPGPNGKGIMHAEIQVGSSIIMIGEENPQQECRSPETLGGSPISLYMYVQDVDKSFRRALEAGAQERMPVQDMFWGDRIGAIQDPFGYSWTLATHTKDPTPEEIRKGAEEACNQAVK